MLAFIFTHEYSAVITDIIYSSVWFLESNWFKLFLNGFIDSLWIGYVKWVLWFLCFSVNIMPWSSAFVIYLSYVGTCWLIDWLILYWQQVSIIAPNIPALYEAQFWVLMAGAVLNSGNVHLNASTIAFLFGHSSTVVVMVDQETDPQ